jgi:hypothetical protein
MIFFSDFGGVATPRAVVVQDFATGTTTGSPISYPSTELTGRTAKAVLFVGSGHQIATGSAEEANASFGIGFEAGGTRRAVTIGSQDNLASTEALNARSNVGSFLLADMSGGSTFARASGVAVSGGVEITYTNTSADRRGNYVAFADADFSAACGNVDMGSGTSAVTVTPSFETDVVFVIHANSANFTFGAANNGIISFGIATKDGTQRCVAISEPNAASAGRPLMALLTDCVGSGIASSTGAEAWSYAAGNFTATAFDLTPSASMGGVDVAYLALDLDSRQAKIIDFTTPTSTGSQSFTGAGFTPSFALVVLTNLEATDPTFPITTDDLMAGCGICSVGNEQWGHSYRINSGADPTDTASFTGAYAVLGPSATDAKAILATWTSFDSDGMTVNYSAVQGAGKKGFILFVE